MADNGVVLEPRKGSFGRNQYSKDEDLCIKEAYEKEGSTTKKVVDALADAGFSRSVASVTYRIAKLSGKR